MEAVFLFYPVIFFLLAILSLKLLSPKNKINLPPGPRSLPIIGHLHLLNNTPHQTFHNLCTRYGPLIHLRLGKELCVIASSPEMAKELIITNGHASSSRPINIAIDLLTYDSAGFGFAPYGPYWKFLKKIVTTELLGERTLSRLKHIRFDETSEFLSLLLSKAKAGKVVDLSQEVSKVSNNIISRMMLNLRCSGEDEQAEEMKNLVREATSILPQFNLSDFIGVLRHIDVQGIKKKAKDLHFRYNALLEKIIKEHEEIRKKNKNSGNDGSSTKDFLDILLDTAEDETAQFKLTRENIKAFMFDFLTAGTDTSGITVEWAMSELINHPNLLRRAAEEIDSVVGKDRLVKESDIANLPFLQAIFKETLRLHPPIPIFEREATEDCNVAGYDIPAKTILFVNNWTISRDPKNWKTPLEFLPDRFMSKGGDGEDASSVDVRGQHFSLLPFGTGRRGCPGSGLATQIIPTILALLIQCFDWKIPPNSDNVTPKLVDMTEEAGLTVPKALPLILLPSIRLSPFPIPVDL